jgi:hypothetical protein
VFLKGLTQAFSGSNYGIYSPKYNGSRETRFRCRDAITLSQWVMVLKVLPIVTLLLPTMLPFKFLTLSDVTDFSHSSMFLCHTWQPHANLRNIPGLWGRWQCPLDRLAPEHPDG